MNQQETRKFYLYKLERDWPRLKSGLRNGRKLNRLSTTQLKAKLGQLQRMLDAKRAKIVETQLSSFYNIQVRPASSKLDRLLQTQDWIRGIR